MCSMKKWPARRAGQDEARPKGERNLAGPTRLELATSGVTVIEARRFKWLLLSQFYG
jgi:hypothetical protein